MERKEDEKVCPNCGWVEGTMPESPIFLIPGTVLQDKYLIGRVLGQGGFGITYLGWDMFLDLKMAIKEYFPQKLASRAAGHSIVSAYSGSLGGQFEYGLGKFLQEARTLAQFEEHPSIVSVLDYFQSNGTAYLVMSYIEGVTFKNYLAEHGQMLAFEETKRIIDPVINALMEVHSANILHRDVSPDNICINRRGQVVLIDFGAARQAVSEKGRGLSVILKPGYTPEEQYRSSGIQGPWTDIYALAATMYRALTGRMPPESLDRLVDDTITTPSELGIGIPDHVERALMKALSVRAEDRFNSIEEFANALNNKYIAVANEMNQKHWPEELISQEPGLQTPMLTTALGTPDDSFLSDPKKGLSLRSPVILGLLALLLIIAGFTSHYFSQNGQVVHVVGLDSELKLDDRDPGGSVFVFTDELTEDVRIEDTDRKGIEGNQSFIYESSDSVPIPMSDPPASVVDVFINATLISRNGSSFDYDFARELMTRSFAARFTSTEFIPQIYGIQDGPTDYAIISEEISGSSAIVSVYGYWGLDISRQWDFSLREQNDRWLISGIKALPGPEPEDWEIIDSANFGIVNVSILHLRQGPGTEFEIIGRLERGTRLEILDFMNEWLYVLTESEDYGWVHGDYVR